MFTSPLDTTHLRQGDIIRDVVFPIARPTSTRILGRPSVTRDGKLNIEAPNEGTQDRPFHFFQVQGTSVPCAVLSQCCDIDPKQRQPPPSFVLCKLVPVPKGVRENEERYNRLKANVDPYGEERGFLQLFWLGFVPALQTELVADFGQVMTVSWSDYQDTLSKKIAELDDLNRAKFRVKIGAHFGRAAAEDKAAGLEDPYHSPSNPSSARPPYARRLAQALRLIFGRER